MVDEIKVGLLISTVTLTIATFFLFSAFQSYSALKSNLVASERGGRAGDDAGDGGGAAARAGGPLQPRQAAVSSQVQVDTQNPEKSLKDMYESQSYSELDRCLGGAAGSGSNTKNGLSLSESCKTTMKLLYDSCQDPLLHIAACNDPRLKEYAPLFQR